MNKQLKSIQKDEKQNNDELNLVQDKQKPALGNKKKNQKKPPPNQTNPPIKPGSTIVASIKIMQSIQIVQLMVSNVAVVKK